MLEKKLACINLSSINAIRLIERINPKIDQAKLELEKLHSYATQGAMLRTKTQYFEMGEQSTKYFFSLEKRNARNKTIQSTYTEEGRLTIDSIEVLKQQASFFHKLYTRNENVCFDKTIDPKHKVSEVDKKEMDKEITIEEVRLAISQMKKGKAPGIDGIPADFYKMFYCRLKFLLHEMFCECIRIGRMMPMARIGIISLIPKKNRDLRWIKNWCPIILLCVDYKILAKIIANRVKSVLDNLIGKEQSAFIKGRNINNSIRKIVDTVNYCDRKQLNSLLLSIDFEKAFDRVEYLSVEMAMKSLNFGKNIIQWTRILYDDFQLSTMNNGYFSEYITPTQGLFQGNPYSCYGFLIIIEFLAIMLRENKKIEGVKIGHMTNLLEMFADDITIFMQNNAREWCAIRDTISKFEQMSGLKVNYDKTLIYRLGSAKNSVAKFYSRTSIQWTDDSVELLGIKVTESEEKMKQINIKPVFSKIKAVLDIWKMYNLSLIGKILVINTLIASTLTYKMSVLPLLGKEYYKEFNQIIENFLWNGKKAKIPLKILQGNKDEGGFMLFDIEKRDLALKIKWIFNMNNPLLQFLADDEMENKLGLEIWNCIICPQDIKLLTSRQNFWIDVWKAWCS